jgi:hypothetical protein
MKRKYIILIMLVLIVFATITCVLAYRMKDEKAYDRLLTEQGNGRAVVTVPEGITKIRIVDGTHMDVLTLDGDSIEEFFTRINSVAGTVEYVGEGSGYAYSVQCYKNDKRVLCFSFLTETIIREYVGDGTDRQFTAEQAIPAFAYIQSLFEEARARN